MDVQEGKLKRVRELLRELDSLEDAIDVRSYNDSKITVVFTTAHDQVKTGKRKVATIELRPKEASKIVAYVLKRQTEIIAELEQL